MKDRITGIRAAFASAVFLGLAPVFGRQAILLGITPLAVVALRTILAAFLLIAVTYLFQRPYLYIYPAGLLGCLLAGGINGLGSLLFYGSLARINASVGQLLNSTYPLFVAIWLTLDKQKPSRLTLIRLTLSIPAIFLLTQANGAGLDMIGVFMMLGAAALYALHIPINQRVLLDMPAQTVTLYTMIAMSAVVVPAFFLFDSFDTLPIITPTGWGAVAGLTVVTFLSRITLFLGIKHLGGMQTAIIGLSELIITLLIAILWLGESLSFLQWIGAAILMGIVFMVAFEKSTPTKQQGGLLQWITPPTPNIDIDSLI